MSIVVYEWPMGEALAGQVMQRARELEVFAGKTTAAVVRRWVWWREIKRALPSDLLKRSGLDFQANVSTDAHDLVWANVVRGLDRGEFELCAKSADGQSFTIGVVRAGSVPRPLNLWPVVPVLVKVIAGAAAVGAWVLADMWLKAQQTFAHAEKLHAENLRAMTEAIARAKTTADADALSRAFARAQDAAARNQPSAGILDTIAKSAGEVARNARDWFDSGLGTLVLVGLGLYALQRRRRR